MNIDSSTNRGIILFLVESYADRSTCPRRLVIVLIEYI